MNRKQITDEEKKTAIEFVKRQLEQQLELKGYGTFSSIHEVLGVMEEERKELVDEVHINNHRGIVNELADIAVTCIWGIASIHSDKVDW